MVDNINYINIREILSRVLRNNALQGLSLEDGIAYTIDFIRLIGLPNVFLDNTQEVEIKNYRGLLPCDLISINQVMDCRTKICLRAMTDNFNGIGNRQSQPSFKTQGRYIYTSFEEGKVLISYKAIKVDEDGLPMIPDDPTFLKALELYIKAERFTILFDNDKLGQNGMQKLQNAQQQYAFAAARCRSRFTMLSVSEMQSLTGMLHQLVPKQNEFKHGFRNMGDKEYIKVQ